MGGSCSPCVPVEVDARPAVVEEDSAAGLVAPRPGTRVGPSGERENGGKGGRD